MDFFFSDADRLFREEVRTWLRENVPDEVVPVELAPMREFDLAWQRTQFDAGWAGIAWPTEYGGRGMTLTQQLIWYEEYALADDELARRLADARAEVAALRAMTLAVVSRNARTPTPGPEGSMVKLYFATLKQNVATLAMDILGLDGLRFVHHQLPGGLSGDYLYSYSASIGGGTSEILRNIIGDRVLGLPREATRARS